MGLAAASKNIINAPTSTPLLDEVKAAGLFPVANGENASRIEAKRSSDLSKGPLAADGNWRLMIGSGAVLIASSIVVGVVQYGRPDQAIVREFGALVAVLSAISIAPILIGLIKRDFLERITSGSVVNGAQAPRAVSIDEAARTHTLQLASLAGVLLVAAASVLSLFIHSGSASSVNLMSAPLMAGCYLLLHGFGSLVQHRAKLFDSRDPFLLLGGGSRDQVQTIPALSNEGNVSLEPGMLVPCDLRIESGSCCIDERALSPIPQMRVRDEGEIVFAGSRILGGTASGYAIATPLDSCLSRVQQLCAPVLLEAEEHLYREDDMAVRGTSLALIFCAVAAAISWSERGVDAATILVAAGMVLFAGSFGEIRRLIYAARRDFHKAWAQRGFLITNPPDVGDLCNVSKVLFESACLEDESEISSVSLELLDDRVGRAELCSTLISLLGRADDAALSAAGTYCRGIAGTLTPDRVLNLREYEGRGMCGSLRGVELSVGDEDFLIERGILFQPSDALPIQHEEEKVLFVGVDDDVVARFRITVGRFNLVRRKEDHTVWPVGIEPSLWEDSKDVSSKSLVVHSVASQSLAPSGGLAPRLSVTPFSDERFELPSATIISLGGDYSFLGRLIKSIRSQVVLVTIGRVLASGACVVAVSCVFLGFLNPLVPTVMFLSLSAGLLSSHWATVRPAS